MPLPLFREFTYNIDCLFLLFEDTEKNCSDFLKSLLFYLAVISYSSTTTPIERHVPATMLIAASTVAAFKSGIFISAIS